MGAVTLTYRCRVCKTVVTLQHDADDGPPECGVCHGDTTWQPGMFAITGAKSQAVDIAQRVAEQQFGLTDLKDNTREGEAAFKPTPMQSKMAEMANDFKPPPLTPQQQAMAESYWGGSKKGPNESQQAQLAMSARGAMAEAEALGQAVTSGRVKAVNAQDAKWASEGYHPLKILHSAKPKFPWKTIQG